MQQKDLTTTIQELKKIAQQFRDDREWKKFHTPKDLSMYLSIEAAELMEKFLWISEQESFQEVDKNRKEIEDEVGDVFILLLHFCNSANIDLTQATLKKLELSTKKYPIEKSKGISTKYNKL